MGAERTRAQLGPRGAKIRTERPYVSVASIKKSIVGNAGALLRCGAPCSQDVLAPGRVRSTRQTGAVKRRYHGASLPPIGIVRESCPSPHSSERWGWN
jgi:hypothetical protein